MNFPRVLGRNPTVAGSSYVETMFYSSSHLPSDDAAVTVKDDTGNGILSCPKPAPATREQSGRGGRGLFAGISRQ